LKVWQDTPLSTRCRRLPAVPALRPYPHQIARPIQTRPHHPLRIRHSQMPIQTVMPSAAFSICSSCIYPPRWYMYSTVTTTVKENRFEGTADHFIIHDYITSAIR